MKHFLIFVAVFGGAFAVLAVYWYSGNMPDKWYEFAEPRSRSEARMDKLTTFVAKDFRDPEGARFRNITKTTDGDYCGEVNRKNALGGYARYKRFFVAGNDVFDRPMPLSFYRKKCGPSARRLLQRKEQKEHQLK